MNEKEQEARQLICGRYVIAVLRAVLHKTEVPPLPPELSWPEVYDLARAHAVEDMVFSAVEPLLGAEQELCSRWHRRCDQDMVQTLTQMSEEPRLLSAFSGAGLRALPVKGSALRVLYPSPAFRQMSDIDLTVPPEQAARAVALMAELGYQPQDGDLVQGHEASFSQPPFLSVELHDCPVKPDDPRAGYYRAIWAKARPDPELPGIFHLRAEDEYLYLLVHFLQHYEDAGIGIRQVMDVWVFLQAHGPRMDEAYLAQEAGQLGISAQREQIEKLAGYCFSARQTEKDAELEEVAEYCILSGSYGTHRSRSMAIMRAAQGGQRQKPGWKLRYLLRRIFPPAEQLYRRYDCPEQKRRPWLLPLLWLRRLLDIRYWKEHFRSEMSALMDDGKKK